MNGEPVRRSLLRIWIPIAIGSATTTGCQSELELIPVHGQVLYEGNPLEFGSVMFQPEGSGPLARGTIESDGTFVLGTKTKSDGVRPGVCRVRVTSFAAQKAGQAAYQEREMALGSSGIPKKYQNFGTSGIVVEVRPQMELPLILKLE